MLSAPDFVKKQIVFVFMNRGEKLNFQMDNLIVKNKEGKIKYQMSCYRLFIIYVIGQMSITTGLIQRTKKFGFSIALMTHSFRLYYIINMPNEGNILLRKRQYENNDLQIAKLLVANKVANQLFLLMQMRKKETGLKQAISLINSSADKIAKCEYLSDLMGTEGNIARIYFQAYFDNVNWDRRLPRVKSDMTNALLDIGYTLLFTFLEALLNIYGFDLYCGMMHRPFYMRKSLVCDLIEPFRFLIDAQVKKGINLGQFREEDFWIENKRYILNWEKSADYVYVLMQPILDYKEDIFLYVQGFYRAFMRNKKIDEYPCFTIDN